MKNILGTGISLLGLVAGVSAAVFVYDLGWNHSDLYQEMLTTGLGQAPLAENDAHLKEAALIIALGLGGIALPLVGRRILR